MVLQIAILNEYEKIIGIISIQFEKSKRHVINFSKALCNKQYIIVAFFLTDLTRIELLITRANGIKSIGSVGAIVHQIEIAVAGISICLIRWRFWSFGG